MRLKNLLREDDQPRNRCGLGSRNRRPVTGVRVAGRRAAGKPNSASDITSYC